MRFLVDASHASAALAQPGARLLESYPSFVLIEAPSVPDVPVSAREELTGTSIAVHGRPVDVPEGVFELADAPHTLVRFIGPFSSRWRAQLQRAGVVVLFFAPPRGACLKLPAGLDADALREKFPFLAGAQPYLEEQCQRRVASPSATVRRETGALPGVYDLVCFSREGRVRVEDELRRRGIEILASSSSKVRVRFDGDLAVLRELVGVKLVGAVRAPKLTSTAELATALGWSASTPAGLDGHGQIVAVADTGLDRGSSAPGTLHTDFAGRVREIASWPINPSWAPFVDNPGHDDAGADLSSGHGTYIAGLVLGSGATSGGEHRGLAPAAELVFQAIEQRAEVKAQFRTQIASGYHLAGRPLDLRELFRQARGFGARIHVNAWGDPAGGHYTDDCFEADLFLSENRDALILFAAGNDAGDRDGNRAPDAGSMFAPASAKNVIAVGATEGPVAGVGLRVKWGDLDPSGVRFRASADRVDVLSGEPDRIALFSCTGPTEDGRIKPDVCLPGTNLVAARSQATAARGWGLASPLPYYMYDGGTSAATGAAGGFFAVLRQAWAEARAGVAPSGAALKALAVLGTRAVVSRRAGSDEAMCVAGFGRLDLARSLPARIDGETRLVDELDPGLESGEAREFAFVQSQSGPFRAVLAWYDAPGERLVNDLDLSLVGANGVIAWGNHAPGQIGAPDRVNTLERIDLPALAPGSYRLRVVAREVLQGPQPFALAYFAPRAALPDVPVEWLNGIGARAAKSLAQNGIARLCELRGKSHAELETLTGIRGATLARIEANLALALAASALALDPAIPRNLPLARVADAAPPAGVSNNVWSTARTLALPALLAFDKTRLGGITLGRLFA